MLSVVIVISGCHNRHIVKDCKEIQSIKNHKVQEESDDEDNKENNKKQGFGEDLK